MIKRVFIATFVLLILSQAVRTVGAEDGRAKDEGRDIAIPKQLRELLIGGVVPAYRLGLSAPVIASVQALLGDLTSEQVTLVNEWLVAQRIPPLEEILSEALYSAALFGQAGTIEELGPKALAATIPKTRQRIQKVLGESKVHAIMEDPVAVPESLLEFEQFYWRVHRFEQRVDNAIRVGQFGAALHDRAVNVLKKASPEEFKILSVGFSLEELQLNDLKATLAERKVEVQLARFKLAHFTLKSSVDARKQFEAAFAIDNDGPMLLAFFEAVVAGQIKPTRSSLTVPGLGDRLNSMYRESLAIAGDKIEKAQLFHVGLYWWLRGRYGSSLEGGGLLKPRAALRSPEMMFGLHVPAELYGPPTKQQKMQPTFQRRHNVIWSFEPGQVVQQQRQGAVQRGKTEPGYEFF